MTRWPLLVHVLGEWAQLVWATICRRGTIVVDPPEPNPPPEPKRRVIIGRGLKIKLIHADGREEWVTG